jgi:hypothetical protein
MAGVWLADATLNCKIRSERRGSPGYSHLQTVMKGPTVSICHMVLVCFEFCEVIDWEPSSGSPVLVGGLTDLGQFMHRNGWQRLSSSRQNTPQACQRPWSSRGVTWPGRAQGTVRLRRPGRVLRLPMARSIILECCLAFKQLRSVHPATQPDALSKSPKFQCRALNLVPMGSGGPACEACPGL